MKINVTSASAFLGQSKIIEVNSIEDAIKRLQTDKELVKSIIDENCTWLDEDLTISRLVLNIQFLEEDCDYEIEIYDYYRE